MTRRHPRSIAVVLASLLALLALGGTLAADVGRGWPGFFVAPDHRVFPLDGAAGAAGLGWGSAC